MDFRNPVLHFKPIWNIFFKEKNEKFKFSPLPKLKLPLNMAIPISLIAKKNWEPDMTFFFIKRSYFCVLHPLLGPQIKFMNFFENQTTLIARAYCAPALVFSRWDTEVFKSCFSLSFHTMPRNYPKRKLKCK